MSTYPKSKEKDVEEFFNLSGASMNRVHSSDTPSKGAPAKTKMLHINLYDFDEPKYEDSKYVLTSPRSLEACSRFGVKPVELIYKPLMEFQEELVPQGFSLRTICQIFDAQEHERLNKLQLCREEREKIVIEDQVLGVPTEGPVIISSPQPTRQMTVANKLTLGDVCDSDAYQYLEHQLEMAGRQGRHTGHWRLKLGLHNLTVFRSSTDYNVDDGGDDVDDDRGVGSLQRHRTAWTTGVGHRRITQQEINARAKEIYDSGEKIRRQNLARTRRRLRAKSAPNKQSVDTETRRRPASARTATIRKKQERQQRPRKPDRGSQDSINDVSSVTSSRASRPWIRDPLGDAKPITDPVLRQKLQGIGASSSRLNARRSSIDGTHNQNQPVPVMRTSDQKILQLMIAKREAERKQQERRDLSRVQWENDRRKEAAARNAAENRRRTLSERKRATSSLSCLNHHSGTGTPCGCGRNHDRQVDVKPRTPKDSSPKQYGHNDGVENGEPCRRSWVMASQKRAEVQKQQMQEKKMRELERKKSVEKRLEEQRRETEEYENKLREKQERDMQKAEQVRASQEQQKELARKLKKFQAEQRYKDKAEVLKRQSMEDLAAMKATIDLRGHLSRGKRNEITNHNEHDSRRRSLDLDKKVKKYQGNKSKMDQELQHWHEDLLQYRQLQEQRAEQLAKQQAIERAKRAQEERIAKQKLQKENMKKLLSAEEEWKAEVEASIALKDSKSKMLLRDKEESIQQSRAMAQTTQRLRENLRNHYSYSDLDKLNQQAELEARLSTHTLESTTANLAKLSTD